MFGSGHELKIFKSVIATIAVDVVNVFFGEKESAKVLLHNQSVSEHILAAMIGVWV